ncbi:uncharacterized protein BXZ73DRAFT_28562, partial [Epithele typhae]|uniref:uncharacterized protein n=1 Tax=Epithele typhae TaxID=378194 RepID=UPI002008C2CB
KTEACHFTRKRTDANPPLDLGKTPFTGDSPLQPVEVLRHLGFNYLDRKLTFHYHVRVYATPARALA